MKQKIGIIFTYLFLLLGFFLAVSIVKIPQSNAAEVGNTNSNCVGNICAILSDDLPTGATGVDPNKTYNLSFSLTTANGGSFSCRVGNLYHFVKHYIGGMSSTYEYILGGSGPEVNLSFNTGGSGQVNRANAIFYCSNSQLTGSSTQIDSAWGVLYSGQLGWQTPEFNQTTRQQTNQGTQQSTTQPSQTPQTPANSTGNTNDCTANSSAANCFSNPVKVDNLVSFVLLMMKWLLALIGSFSVLFIMIGGFRMVLSQGNEEAYGVAKKTVTYAIIGLVVAVLSFSMVAIVSNILNANVKNASQTTEN